MVVKDLETLPADSADIKVAGRIGPPHVAAWANPAAAAHVFDLVRVRTDARRP